MDKDLSKPLAQAQVRIEAERARIELWFTDAMKEGKTEQDADEILLGYVFHRFMSFAQETYNASLEMNWSAAELRETFEGALSTIIDQTFESKHYRRNRPDPSAVIGSKAEFTELATNDVYSSNEWREMQEKLKELAEWQAENGTKGTPSLIGRLSKDALVRMEAATAAFMAEYLPKLDREGNKSLIHDAELLRELVIHQYNLVAWECMAVCDSVEEFEGELRSDIARFVQYGLSQYQWLADSMREELDQGFTLFVMGMNPWAGIPEADRATAWRVGAITGEALSHAALKRRAEAWKHAADGGFSKPDEPRTVEGGQTQPQPTSGLGSNAGARAAFVEPILETKGWSILDWANESKVDFHTANDYLKGSTNPYRSTRKKLAEALGVPVEALPK